jgi:carboxymethylenebutenolidase
METPTSGTAPGPSSDASTFSGRLKKVDQVVFDLFDQYVHGFIDRRGFLERASKLVATGATAGMTATVLLDALNPRFAEAEQVPRNDERLRAESVSYDSPAGTGTVRGYLARPAIGKGALPVVLVVHENRGLNPHIEDITRRLAVAGYMAFAPDALTRLGGYPGNEDKARKLFAKLDPAKTREDFAAAVAFLAPRSDCDGHVGALGFSYGGGAVNTLATRVATLGAAVAFYGGAPDLAAVPHIKAPLQLHYAEKDERVNASAPAYEAALKANHVTYEVHRYPGTQHGFNNDTTPRFDKDAAALAWRRTLEFFQTHLRGSGGTAARP